MNCEPRRVHPVIKRCGLLLIVGLSWLTSVVAGMNRCKLYMVGEC